MVPLKYFSSSTGHRPETIYRFIYQNRFPKTQKSCMISTHKRRTINIGTNSFCHFGTFFTQMSFTKFSSLVSIHFWFLVIYILTNKRHVMSTLGTNGNGMIFGTSPFETGTIRTRSAYMNLRWIFF